jgi:hypothetical protein
MDKPAVPMAVKKDVASQKGVEAVSSRLEQTFHSVTALHELCELCIGGHTSGDPNTHFVLMRDVLRSIARDMENCAEILSNDRGGFGFFEHHYGSV